MKAPPSRPACDLPPGSTDRSGRGVDNILVRRPRSALPGFSRSPRRALTDCGRRFLATGFLGLLVATGAVRAESLPFTFTKVGAEYRLKLESSELYYFGFQKTPDLLKPFDIIQMALGTPGPVFGYVPAAGELRAFFRARGISVSAPEDQDGDYLDDLWELQHPYLNPLYPNDAFLASPEPDAGGRSNLDYYFWKRGTIPLREVYSREASIFNFGQPTAAQEAVSREASVFNFGSPPANVEAISPEISVFNGESVPTSGIAEAYSREVTTFNFGSPPANLEAVSRELTVFNGESVPTGDIPEVYSREVTTFKFGSPPANVETMSREVSVLNTDP